MPGKKHLKSLSQLLGMKTQLLRRHLGRAIIARWAVMQEAANGGKPQLVQLVKSTKKSRLTKEITHALHQWLLTKCDLVVDSPKQNDRVYVRDLFSGKKVKQQKKYRICSIAELHNAMIADPVNNGGFAGARDQDGKVCISDTMLRNLLPRNLKQMTNSHKQLCGCETCIIAKELCITLITWETKQLNYLKFDHQLDTTNAEKKSKLDTFTAEAFTLVDDKPQHRFKTPKEAAPLMSCPLKSGGLYCFPCALEQCSNCPEFPIPALELDTSESAPTIAYQVYRYHSFCTVHHSLPPNDNGIAPSKCTQCEANRQQQHQPESPGKVSRKKQLTRTRKKIGVRRE